jgi:hypothetical protein
MTKLTVHPTTTAAALPATETASAKIIAQANRSITVTGGSGRVYTLRRPDLLATVRLIEIIGAEAAQNPVLLNLFTVVLHVIAIDAEPVAPPHTRRQIDAVIQRIDQDYGTLAEAAQGLNATRSTEDLKAAVGN